jgi:dTMP kinase
MEERYGGNAEKKDIHEKDNGYLQRCYDAGIYACGILGMCRVPCIKEGDMLPAEEINDYIYSRIKEKLSAGE